MKALLGVRHVRDIEYLVKFDIINGTMESVPVLIEYCKQYKVNGYKYVAKIKKQLDQEMSASPLFKSIYDNDFDTVKKILENMSTRDKVRNGGMTYARTPEMRQLLVDNLIMIHGRILIDKPLFGNGCTQIIYAAKNPELGVVMLLSFIYGGDPTLKDYYNRTAMDYAIESGYDDEYLIDIREKEDEIKHIKQILAREANPLRTLLEDKISDIRCEIKTFFRNIMWFFVRNFKVAERFREWCVQRQKKMRELKSLREPRSLGPKLPLDIKQRKEKHLAQVAEFKRWDEEHRQACIREKMAFEAMKKRTGYKNATQYPLKG